MQQEEKQVGYKAFITNLKDSILNSRYNAARLANREQLLLYYAVGSMLDEKLTTGVWGNGTKIIEKISADLQKELPGLRGFSTHNLKKMRQFYTTYPEIAGAIGLTVSIQLPENRGVKGEDGFLGLIDGQHQLFIKTFTSLGFSHHILLLSTVKKPIERWFYMLAAVKNQWSYRILEHHIESKLYKRKGKLANNFENTLPPMLKNHALEAFKDEYLLDFIDINIEYERDLENSIVANIKQFIMALGHGFAFIGNQYRLVVGKDEFFIDLLFYNRVLKCMVVFELKREKFKPEHAGQLNFYLNILDDQLRLPGENPSIGIILCKEKDNTQIEYAFKSIDKAMGVATYKLTNKVPRKMKHILPSPDELSRLL